MLDIRLQTIYDMLKKGMIVADIGSDHAFLPIELVKTGKSEKVYACEIADGPLLRAKNNIEKYGFSDKVIAIKSDGLNNVPIDTEAIVVAGVGFYTVKKIFEDNLSRLDKFKQIIIQVNSDIDLLRKWISDNNFTIENEIIIKKRHYYTIIEISTKYNEGYNSKEILFGPVLMKTKTDVYIYYLSKELIKYKKILPKVDYNKKEEINKKIKFINEIIK